MGEKILLIDGHSILNRAFFGLPELTNSEGLHTNGVYGFLNILLRVLEEEKPDYMAVAFDVHAPTFRHKMYAEYKGTRKPMAPELKEQVPLLKEMLKAMQILTVEKEGLEADDILGTLSRECEEAGLSVSVLSGDRDLLQLATERVMIRIPKTKRGQTEVEDYLAQDVKEKYGVNPLEFIDMKALMGDASDNIPGVPGIGEKTASAIIQRFHSIEEAHAQIDQVTPNRARENLKTYWDQAVLSKTLATIEVHAKDLDFSLDRARRKEMFTEEAYLLCRRLEFKNLLKYFTPASTAKEEEEDFWEVYEEEGAEQLLSEASKENEIGFKYISENGRLLGLAVAWGKSAAFLRVGEKLKEDYLYGKIVKGATIGLKEQLDYIPTEDSTCFFDTKLAAYLLNPLRNAYEYEDLAKDYCDGRLLPGKEELLHKLPLAKAMEEYPEEFLRYVCYEASVALTVKETLAKELEEKKETTLFREIEMPLAYTLHDMERVGIRMDPAILRKYSDDLTNKIEELERQIYEEAGESFNINSPKQLGEILFERMKLPYGKKTKTGYSTAADVLEKLAPEHPFVAHVLSYRGLTKLKSTYADGLTAFVAADGRIHTTFHQTITATGRLSSADPNLQNIPIRNDLGRQIRKAFLPEEGWVFLDADYSQIELRVLAHLSGDENLIKAYNSAQDIHALTASEVFHVPLEEVTPMMRRNAKAVNFGIVYGISSFGLSEDLSISRKEAKEYIERYFEVYPRMHAFLQELVADAKEKGYVTTMFGRIRPVPELSSSNFMQRSFGERVAMNSPIQGTAADIIKLAMLRVHRRLKKEGLKSRLVVQVHDELLVETFLPEKEAVERILSEEMTQAAELLVPLEIDLHEGRDWYEAK
ncbi:MAG: DNA polymerase I [Lachnospiraceae bacterium]|nr:DNA polymerase I [Lachnospiraceae bacterium]